jgi:hypothetical protein
MNRTINWPWLGDGANLLALAVLLVIVIGLPILSTAFLIQLFRRNWGTTEVPSVSTYVMNYSFWLFLIWSKILIGW